MNSRYEMNIVYLKMRMDCTFRERIFKFLQEIKVTKEMSVTLIKKTPPSNMFEVI